MSLDIKDIIGAHQRGDLAGAEAGYRAILAVRPDDSQALQMLCMLLMQGKRPAEAAELYGRVVAADAANPGHWANFGGLLRGAGRAEAAGAAYRRALALDPAHGAGAFNLANLLAAAPGGGGDAAVWFARILSLAPEHRQARNNLDILRQADPARFEAAVRRELLRDPDSAHAHDQLAQMLLRRSGLLDWYPGKACAVDLAGAVRAFDHRGAALTLQPDDAERRRSWLALALDLLQLGALDDVRLARAARAAWRRLRSDPKDALAAALVGYHVYRRGRLTLASRLQRRFLARFTAAEVAADRGLGYWSMLRADDAFFDRLPPVESVVARLPALETLAEPASGTGPVILMSGDDHYVRRFGPDLLQSIAGHSPGAAVVLNIVAPSAETLALVADWRGRYPLDLGLSCERPDLSGWSADRRSTYFASARFIRAFQWQRRLNRPLIVVDLDAVVRDDLRRLAGDRADHDLGLMLDRRRRGPFREILVGFACYNDTPAAARFLATVAAYIGHFLLDGEPRWMLDQTAHLAVLDRLRRAEPAPRVRWHDFQGFAHCAFVGEK